MYKKRSGETTNTSEKVHKSLTARLGVFIKKKKEKETKTNFPLQTCLAYPFPPYQSPQSGLSAQQFLHSWGKKTQKKKKKAGAELTESLAPFDVISAQSSPKVRIHQLFLVTVILFPSSLGMSLPESVLQHSPLWFCLQ